MLKKIILIVLVVGIGGFLLFQLVPYGKDHTNPPVVQEPAWDSPATPRAGQARLFRLPQQRSGLAVVQQHRAGFLVGGSRR